VTGSRVRVKRLVESLGELGSVTVIVAGKILENERQLLSSWGVGRVVLAPMQPRSPSRP
jgi:hypothetical protein